MIQAAGDDTRGFSLIEVLAALTILAIALSALYASFGTALRAGNSAGQRLAAVQLAQSLIEGQILGRVLQRGGMQGRQDAYQWQITVEPVEDQLPLAPPDAQLQSPQTVQAPRPPPAIWQLYQITVTVTWPRQRRIQIATLHLARAP